MYRNGSSSGDAFWRHGAVASSSVGTRGFFSSAKMSPFVGNEEMMIVTNIRFCDVG